MKEMKISEKEMMDEQGNQRIFYYYLLVDEVEVSGISCENYGVCVEERHGEIVRVPHITASYARIAGLLDLLERNLVSPTILQDVVHDWL